MKPAPRIIEYYEDDNGNFPAHQWLKGLKDKTTRTIIKGRIRRLEEGNFGYTCGLGDGVLELKIDYGPGYRVYLGQDGITLVIILAVGTKSTQARDIEKAKQMWKNYQERYK